MLNVNVDHFIGVFFFLFYMIVDIVPMANPVSVTYSYFCFVCFFLNCSFVVISLIAMCLGNKTTKSFFYFIVFKCWQNKFNFFFIEMRWLLILFKFKWTWRFFWFMGKLIYNFWPNLNSFCVYFLIYNSQTDMFIFKI